MTILEVLGALGFLLSLFILFKILEIEKRLKEVSEYYKDVQQVEKHILLLRKEFKEIDETYGEVGEIARRLKELEELWRPLKPKVEELSGALDSVRKDMGRMDELIQSLHSRIGSVEELSGRLEALEGQLKEIVKKNNLMEENITQIDTQVVQNRENLTRLERSLDKLSEKLEEISTVVGGYLQFRDEVLSKVSDLSTKIATTEGRVKKLESFLEYMRGVERNVREIKAKFEAFDKGKGLLFDLLMEVKQEVGRLKKMVDKLRAPQVYDTLLRLQGAVKELEDIIGETRAEVIATRRLAMRMKERYDYLTMPGKEDLEFFKRELDRVRRKTKELAEEI